jgi:trigger factor
MNAWHQRYGYSVQYEVMNDKVGQAFASAAKRSRNCVSPACPASPREAVSPEGQMAFDAVFEVFPRSRSATWPTAEVERVSAEVTDAAIDKTSRSCASSAAPLPARKGR